MSLKNIITLTASGFVTYWSFLLLMLPPIKTMTLPATDTEGVAEEV